MVSIAGAILWGEQPDLIARTVDGGLFQSQGRFSGGSNVDNELEASDPEAVSIAGAILWGEQQLPCRGPQQRRQVQSQERCSGEEDRASWRRNHD